MTKPPVTNVGNHLHPRGLEKHETTVAIARAEGKLAMF